MEEPGLIVLLLADCICWKLDSKARMGRQSHLVLVLRDDDLDLHRAGCQGSDLFLHPVTMPGYMVVPPDNTMLA